MEYITCKFSATIAMKFKKCSKIRHIWNIQHTINSFFFLIIKQAAVYVLAASVKWSIHAFSLSIFFRSTLTYLLNLSNTGNLTTDFERGSLNFKQNLQLSQQSTIILKNTLSAQPLSFNNLINWSFEAWHNWWCSFIALFFSSSVLNSKFVKNNIKNNITIFSQKSVNGTQQWPDADHLLRLHAL